MPENKDYISNVHKALTSKVEGFDVSEFDFRTKMQDESYVKNVHKALVKKVQGFDVPESEFVYGKVGLKKKDDTGQGSATPAKPSGESGVQSERQQSTAGNVIPSFNPNDKGLSPSEKQLQIDQETATKRRDAEIESRNASKFVKDNTGLKAKTGELQKDANGVVVDTPNKGIIPALQDKSLLPSSEQKAQEVIQPPRKGSYAEFEQQQEEQQYVNAERDRLALEEGQKDAERAKKYGEDGWYKRTNDLVGGFDRAVTNAPADILKTGSEILNYGGNKINKALGLKESEIKDNPLYKVADSYSNWMDEKMYKGVDKESSAYGLGSGLGQAATMAATGSGSALTLAQRASKAAKITNTLKTSVLPFSQVFNSEFEQKKKEGESDEVAFNQAITNATLSTPLEKMPIANLFTRYNKSIGSDLSKRVLNASAQALEEGSTEYLQQVLSNLTNNQLVELEKNTKSWYDGAGKSAEMGGYVGLLLGVISGVAQGRLKNKAIAKEETNGEQSIGNDLQQKLAQGERESKRAEILSTLEPDGNGGVIMTTEAKSELDKLENARVQVQEPTQQSATNTERAQPSDDITEQQEPVVQPVNTENNQGINAQENGQVPVDETGTVGAVVQGAESVGGTEGEGTKQPSQTGTSAVEESPLEVHPLYAEARAHHDKGIDLHYDKQALELRRGVLVAKKQPTTEIDQQIQAKDAEIESHTIEGESLLQKTQQKEKVIVLSDLLKVRDAGVILSPDFTNNASDIAAKRIQEQNTPKNDTPQPIPDQTSSNPINEDGTNISAGTKISDSVHQDEETLQPKSEPELTDDTTKEQNVPVSVLDQPRTENSKTEKGAKQVSEKYNKGVEYLKGLRNELTPEEIQARKDNADNLRKERADKKKVRELKPVTERQAARQYLLGGGKLSKESIQTDGGLKNHNDHKHLRDIFTSFKKGTKFPSIQQAAHNIWENNSWHDSEITPQDIRNELIALINENRNDWHNDQKSELDPEYIQKKYEESQVPDGWEYEKVGIKEPNDDIAENDFYFQDELSDEEWEKLNNSFYDDQDGNVENGTSKGKSDKNGLRTDQGKHDNGTERNDRGASTQGESIQERFGDTSKSGVELVAEITGKPLSRVEGLNMGQSQARGTYISTEKKNRYETAKNKAKRAFVKLKNPFVFKSESGIHHFRNAIIQEEIQNPNSSFTETDFADYKIPDPWDNVTIDNLSDSGIEKLAGLVADKLIVEGFDSIYWAESKTQEGELVVFDKNNVQLKENLSAKDKIALGTLGAFANIGAVKNFSPQDKNLMENLRLIAEGINELTGEVGMALMEALEKEFKKHTGRKMPKEFYDYKNELVGGIGESENSNTPPPNTPPKSDTTKNTKEPLVSKFSERTIDTEVFSTLGENEKVFYEKIFNAEAIKMGEEYIKNNGHNLFKDLDNAIQNTNDALAVQSAGIQYALGLETKIKEEQAKIDKMNPDDVTNEQLRNIKEMQKQQAMVVAKVSLLGTSQGRGVQILGAGFSLMRSNPEYMAVAMVEAQTLLSEAQREHLTNRLSEDESIEVAEIVDEAITESQSEIEKDKEIASLKKQLEDFKSRKTRKATKDASPESQATKAKKEAQLSKIEALKAKAKADKAKYDAEFGSSAKAGFDPNKKWIDISTFVEIGKVRIEMGAHDFATFSRKIAKDIADVVGSGFDKSVIKNIWNESNLGLEQDLLDKIKAREEVIIAKKAQQIAKRKADQEVALIERLEKQLTFAKENLALVEKGFDKLSPEKKAIAERKWSEEAKALKAEIADVNEQIKELEGKKEKLSQAEKDQKAQEKLDDKIAKLHKKLAQAEKDYKLSITVDYKNPDKKEAVKKQLSAAEELLTEKIQKLKDKKAANLKIKRKLDALVTPKPNKKPSSLFDKIKEALDNGNDDPMGDLDVRMAYAKHLTGNNISTDEINRLKANVRKLNELSTIEGTAMEQAELWDEMMDTIAGASTYTAYDKAMFNFSGNVLSNPFGVTQNVWQSMLSVPSTYVRLWSTGNFKLANKVLADAWDKSMVESAYMLETGKHPHSSFDPMSSSFSATKRRAIEAKLWNQAKDGNVFKRTSAKTQIMLQTVMAMNSQANAFSRGLRDRNTFMTAMIKDAERDNRKLPIAEQKTKAQIVANVEATVFENDMQAYDKAFKEAAERLGLQDVAKRATAYENIKMFFGQVPDVYKGKKRSPKDVTDSMRVHLEAIKAVNEYRAIYGDKNMQIAETIGDITDLKDTPKNLDFNGERKTGATNVFVGAVNSINKWLEKKATDGKESLHTQAWTIAGGTTMKAVTPFANIMINYGSGAMEYIPVIAQVKAYNRFNAMRNIGGAPVKWNSKEGAKSLGAQVWASDDYKQQFGNTERELAFHRMRSRANTGLAVTMTAIAAVAMFEADDDPEKLKKQKFAIKIVGNGMGVPDDMHEYWKKVGGGEQRILIFIDGKMILALPITQHQIAPALYAIQGVYDSAKYGYRTVKGDIDKETTAWQDATAMAGNFSMSTLRALLSPQVSFGARKIIESLGYASKGKYDKAVSNIGQLTGMMATSVLPAGRVDNIMPVLRYVTENGKTKPAGYWSDQLKAYLPYAVGDIYRTAGYNKQADNAIERFANLRQDYDLFTGMNKEAVSAKTSMLISAADKMNFGDHAYAVLGGKIEKGIEERHDHEDRLQEVNGFVSSIGVRVKDKQYSKQEYLWENGGIDLEGRINDTGESKILEIPEDKLYEINLEAKTAFNESCVENYQSDRAKYDELSIDPTNDFEKLAKKMSDMYRERYDSFFDEAMINNGISKPVR